MCSRCDQDATSFFQPLLCAYGSARLCSSSDVAKQMYGDGVNGVTGGGEVMLLSKIRAGVS